MKKAAELLSVPVLALAIALPAAAVEPSQRLQRASGLWQVIPSSSPFSWEIYAVHRRQWQLSGRMSG